MFDISKLAAILEDEGLIKTAALQKGEVYLFQDGGVYLKWSSLRRDVDYKHGEWETPRPGRKRSKLSLAVEYVGGWSAVEKMAARYFDEGIHQTGGGAVDGNWALRYTPQQAKRELKEAEKSWKARDLQIFKVVGKWKGPSVGPYMPTNPWLMVTYGEEVTPLPQDDVMPRMDDPNFDQVPMGSGGRDVTIPRGSFIQRRGGTEHSIDGRAMNGFEIVKDIVARVQRRRDGYEATIPFSTAGIAKPGRELLKRETNKGLYLVWPPGAKR
jgi:hypothetical protein